MASIIIVEIAESQQMLNKQTQPIPPFHATPE